MKFHFWMIGYTLEDSALCLSNKLSMILERFICLFPGDSMPKSCCVGVLDFQMIMSPLVIIMVITIYFVSHLLEIRNNFTQSRINAYFRNDWSISMLLAVNWDTMYSYVDS